MGSCPAEWLAARRLARGAGRRRRAERAGGVLAYARSWGTGCSVGVGASCRSPWPLLAGSNAAPIMIVSMIADDYVNARVSRVAAVRPQHRVCLAHPSWMLLSRVGSGVPLGGGWCHGWSVVKALRVRCKIYTYMYATLDVA